MHAVFTILVVLVVGSIWVAGIESGFRDPEQNWQDRDDTDR